MYSYDRACVLGTPGSYGKCKMIGSRLAINLKLRLFSASQGGMILGPPSSPLKASVSCPKILIVAHHSILMVSV